MIFCVLNHEEMWHQLLLHFPTSLHTVATLPWEIRKSHLSTVSLIHACTSVIGLFTLSQKKTNCTALPTTPEKYHHTTLQNVQIFHFTEDMLHSSKRCWLWKKASCGLALLALKRTCCDVWQMECQASDITANVQSDHLLHGYMLPVLNLHCIVHHALLKFSPCRNKTLLQLVRIADWYSIRVKKCKRWKICAFYKVVRWHFSGVVGKGVTVCFLLNANNLNDMCE